MALLEGINAVVQEVNLGCSRVDPYYSYHQFQPLQVQPLPPRPQPKPQPLPQPYYQQARVSYVDPRILRPAAFVAPPGFVDHHPYQRGAVGGGRSVAVSPMPQHMLFPPNPAAAYCFGVLPMDQPSSRGGHVDPRLISPPRKPSIERPINGMTVPERKREPAPIRKTTPVVWAGLGLKIETLATSVCIIEIDWTGKGSVLGSNVGERWV